MAAGSGQRLGRGVAKSLVALGGIPLFAHSLRAAALSQSIDSAVVVFPERDLEVASRMISDLHDIVPVSAVVAGGATRQESVRRGLGAVPGDVAFVVCHDAARPFASPALYDAVVQAVSGEYRGAVPGVPSRDTVKRVESGRVAETLSRDDIVFVQTPQAFAADALREAHDRAAADGWVTDDAMLLEGAGFAVAVVPGAEMNFKITTEADLRRAEALVASSEL